MKRLYIALNVLLICACGFATPLQISPTQVPEITSVFQQITPPQQPLKVTGIVKADWLEVRVGPGEQYNNVGKWLKKGETIRLYFCRVDGWCKTDGGYIYAEFVGVYTESFR